jgi:hypothetical protein
MYTSIEIDFDVYKELTVQRTSPEMTENDVLRTVLGLGRSRPRRTGSNGATLSNVPWVWKGVTFPPGTELRADYGGRKYYAKIENGAIVYDGKRFKSPSPAANAITGNSVNGWKFWQCRLPGKSGWVSLSKLRK